jgi:hypothetical protein
VNTALPAALASWAFVFIKEKIKRAVRINKRFGAKDFSGIIEALIYKMWIKSQNRPSYSDAIGAKVSHGHNKTSTRLNFF